MNIKRILAVMAVFSLLTGVACADDIMEIVLTESLDDYLNESELVLNDLDIQGAMECQVDGDMEGDLSREADNVGYANQNRQKTITVKKNTSKTVYLGTRYQIVVPNNTIASCKSSSRKVAKVSKTGLITPQGGYPGGQAGNRLCRSRTWADCQGLPGKCQPKRQVEEQQEIGRTCERKGRSDRRQAR